MAMIKINDLQMNEELDQQALSKIKGGSRTGIGTGMADGSAGSWSAIQQRRESDFEYLSAKHIVRKIDKS